jgi:hypothetical protein
MHLFTKFRAWSTFVWLTLAMLTMFTMAQPAQVEKPSPFVTPLTQENLDTSAFAAWVDGHEQPITLKRGPQHVVWTQSTQPEWDGVTFGESKISGTRHLRLGWQTPIPIGTVLVRGGGQLSVLNPTATYPGRLEVESDWLPASRLKEGQVYRDEVEHEEYALWVLPPNTTTRALRFTHTSKPIDRSYAGWLGGVFILPQRWVNLAPQAIASASGNNDKASRLNNESNDDMWKAWDNEPATNAPIISSTAPAWVVLTWPQPVKLSGLNTLWAGFRAADVQ